MDEVHGQKSKKDNRRRRKASKRRCKVCRGEFYAVNDFDTKNGTRKQKYCSKECWSVRSTIYNECKYCSRGIRTTKSQNKKYCDIECRNKDYKNRTKEEASAWKGKDASYSAIHKWIRKHYGKPTGCEECGTDKKLNWANVSGQYKRERKDWRELCARCHKLYDNQWD